MSVNEKGAGVDFDSATIPSSYSRLIARVLKLREHELPMLLHATKLTRAAFLKEDTLLTARQQIQVIDNALRLSKEEDFGLRLGKQLTPATHGAMGFLANSSPNLLMALKAFQTYSPTRMSFTRTRLIMKGDWIESYYHIDMAVNPAIQRCLYEAAALTFFECAEFILGRPLSEAVTLFSHPEPSYSDSYRNYLPGHFEFSHPQAVIRVPVSLCQIPNASANHENYALAMHQCDRMLNQLRTRHSSCKYQTQRLLLSHPPGTLNEDNVAAALFISKRTLARRLENEGTSFRHLRDEILSEQASAYLQESALSVEAIAALLNYHDSSNFRRAFKRWFGMPPDEFRKQLRTL